MITIESLNKSFGTKAVLKNINIVFEKGKIYGIVGENGSGKTTFFKCIAGLESYEGLIRSEFDKLKNHLGFLQTEPFYFSKITGREYIQLLCNARKIGIKDIESANIFELPLSEYAAAYSTGMKKKLALMAILLLGNDVLILDEPFNGVDIHSNILITEIISKLKSLGKTILISSHIFSTLSEICDEIHVLKDGIFVKKASRETFAELEQEMKGFTIGNKVERLGLK